jgi:hypothetical protein
VSVEVKNLLYSVIDQIGIERIRTDITADVNRSEKYCKEIIAGCKNRLSKDATDEALATLCEALLHFMLTASLLPSDRKVAVRNAELDVVIPSTRVLGKSPEKSLVIQVVRGDLETKASQAESVQPRRENIWLISPRPIKTNFRNYHLDSYPRIISDISAFLSEKGERGLKLLP